MHFTKLNSILGNHELSTVSQDLYYSCILIYDSVYVHYVSTLALSVSSVWVHHVHIH